MTHTTQHEADRLSNDVMCRLPGNDGAPIAALLRTIPALEAELDQLKIDLDDELANRDTLDTMLTQCIAERDELRARLEAKPMPEWDNKAYMQAIANLRARVEAAEAKILANSRCDQRPA